MIMHIFKRLVVLFFSFILILAAGCASTSNSEGTGEYIDDTIITAKVKAVIVNDPDLKAREINVETFKGVVQLTGFVSSKDDIRKAIDLAKNVMGVKSVKNDMLVK
jgi:osmotically-inducible protein OsmY